MADVSPGLENLPEALVAPKPRGTWAMVWLVPLIALLVGGWLAIKTILEQGPTITITFKSAEGIEAGKTKIKYKDVEIGKVTKVALTEDLRQVTVTAELVKSVTRHLVEDTTFWVVRARISGGSVSGIGTLLSGAYIGVDVGKSANEQRDFAGLEAPPVVQIDTPGREFALRSDDLGSLDVGSPVFFRRLQVGQIKSYELDKDGKGVSLQVFVNEPYDKFVTTNTRFWNASGVDLTLDSSGIKLQTQSMVSIMLGGVAFGTPLDASERPAAASHQEFNLFASHEAAMKNPETDIVKMALIFNESVRGLAPGAPLDFRGIEIGEVTALHADVDPASKQVIIVAYANLYPERLRARVRGNVALTRKMLGGARNQAKPDSMIELMVEKGLRARLQTGNLLTGQLYIDFDFVKDAPKASIDFSQTPPVLPTVPSSMTTLQHSLANIIKKVEGMPLEQIGANLDQTLKNASALMKRLDTDLAPEATKAFGEASQTLKSMERLLAAESPLQTDARETMRELTRTAQAFRVLADYLERHPEALLRGKQEDQQ
jgi:paraquat-inducible protein B